MDPQPLSDDEVKGCTLMFGIVIGVIFLVGTIVAVVLRWAAH